MNIECILRRPKGTVVEMPGATYHFAPTETDERHVAVVAFEAHAERFLSIPEAYRLMRTGGIDLPAVFAPKVQEAPVLQAVAELLGSTVHPAEFTIHGVTITQDKVVQRAFADSGLPPEDWNGLDDDMRATKLDIVLDALEDGEIKLDEPVVPEPEAAPVDPKAERAALSAQYEAKFGKKPANTMSVDKIRAKLAE